MILTHSNKCECGKEFDTDGTLIPNVRDKEFYGGRINFFKEVKCECGKEYILLIEKNFSYENGMGLSIVDMIDITDEKSYPLETFQNLRRPAKQTVKVEKIDTSEHTLASIVSKETQVETLKLKTMKELQDLCRANKVKFKITESKLALIDKLLEAVPNLVVARET